MLKKLIFSLSILILSVFGLTSCTVVDDGFFTPERPSQIPAGEIWADLNGMFYRFQSQGSVQPLDANAYSADLRFVSMYRELTYNYGTFLIRITNFDIESQKNFPVDVRQSFRISYSPRPNDNYIATESDATLRIESFSGNTIRGTFSGTIRNSSGQSLRVTNGQFHVLLQKY